MKKREKDLKIYIKKNKIIALEKIYFSYIIFEIIFLYLIKLIFIIY